MTGGESHAIGRSAGCDAGLVGRDPEQAVARIAIDHAIAGTPQLVVIEGEPGVGKSALARAIADAMPADSVVLWARCEETERRLDFGVIDQLIREADAAGLSSPPKIERGRARPDPLAIGEVVLVLTEEHSRDRALIVVIDDAQWADLASVQALSFVYRRLHDRRALLVIVQRPDAVNLEPFDRLVRDGRGHRLRLAPLSVPAVIDLVRTRTGTTLTARAAERLHEHTGGNPLETLALVDELDPVALTTGLGALPAPRTYATMVLNRLASCSLEAEHLVAAVAVAGAVEVDELAKMVGTQDLAEPLSEALEHGLVELQMRGGGRVVEVAHPLVRAAVLDDLPPARLCALHAAAAGALDDPERTFLHELRSQLGCRPELAAEGIRRAYARLADGWELSAVELLVTSAELLGPGDARSEALLQASHWLLTAGDAVTAAELVRTAGGAGTPLDLLVRGEMAMLRGDDASARPLFEEAVVFTAAPDVAAKAAGLLATIAANSGRAEEAIEWARRALAIGVETGTDSAYATTMLMSGLVLEGHLAEAEAEIALWASQMGPAADGPDVRYARGVLALWDGRLEEADRALTSLVDDRRVADRGLIAASARYSLADCWYRRGRWDEALAMSEDIARMLDDTDQLLSSPMAHSVAAYVLAARGELDSARRHVAAAEQAIAATGNVAAALWVMTATARIAIAVGDDGAVVDALLPLAGMLRPTGLPAGVQPWRADLVIALVKQGRSDAAERELADFRTRVHAGGAHGRAGLARAAGVVATARGDNAAAATAFAVGLADDADSTGPFVRALLELAAGAFERRNGSRRAAAELLDHAIGRFQQLGAAPFLATALQERRACGVDARDNAGTLALTKAEAAVAALVAEGRTNREVAAALVISVKTVESHLTRIFAKLGVRSRTELAIEWQGGPAVASSDP